MNAYAFVKLPLTQKKKKMVTQSLGRWGGRRRGRWRGWRMRR